MPEITNLGWVPMFLATPLFALPFGLCWLLEEAEKLGEAVKTMDW